jgi:Probable Zinc-ribbon domain
VARRAVRERAPAVVLPEDQAHVYPDIAAEWHPSKNGGLAAEDVLPTTNVTIWWKGTGRDIGGGVRCRHAYRQRLDSRVQGKLGCQACRGKLARERVKATNAERQRRKREQAQLARERGIETDIRSLLRREDFEETSSRRGRAAAKRQGVGIWKNARRAAVAEGRTRTRTSGPSLPSSVSTTSPSALLAHSCAE